MGENDDNGSGDDVYRPEFSPGGNTETSSNSGSQKLHLGNHALSQRIRTCVLNSDSFISLCIAVVILKGGEVAVCYCSLWERDSKRNLLRPEKEVQC